ncbi:MAG: metallophosphoesterase [Candidatus Korobacteraceae bacterium]
MTIQRVIATMNDPGGETAQSVTQTLSSRSLCLSAVLLALFACCPTLQSAATLPNTFLIVSDIHFNPMVDASLVGDLIAADPTQWETILERSKLAHFSQYGEDTNWWLLRSALDQMHATLPHPAFIMVPGDLLAHDFPANYAAVTHDNDREHYRAFVLKTLEFMALQFRKRFGDTTILVTPGNNDEECGDNSMQAHGEFLNDTAELVRDSAEAGRGFKKEWKALGIYNVPHPAIPGIRVISLNTAFFSYRYQPASFSQGCAPVASEADSDLLAWLESSLAAAKQAHEKVWLLFHVPPGVDVAATMHEYEALAKESPSPAGAVCSKAVVPMWEPAWTSQFDSLLENYQDTVIASFAGHTHTDDFRLIGRPGPRQEFVLINPPISPIDGRNPAFRAVTFNSDGSLADQSTYYLNNLKYATSKVKGQWAREYNFSQEWKVKQLNAASLGTIYRRIGTDPKAREQWLKLYNVSSAAAKVAPGEVRGLYCAIGSLEVEGYKSCYCTGASDRGK